MPFDRDALLDELKPYLDEQRGANDFFSWLTVASWDFDTATDPACADLIARLQLAYAEHTAGHRSADELRALTANYARQFHTAALAAP